MSAKNIPSDRKRSRPVEKRKKTDVFKKNKILAAILIIIVIVAVIGAVYIIIQNLPEETANGTTTYEDQYSADLVEAIQGSSYPVAVINTSKGMIAIELYDTMTPITVENYIKLANEGFYDGMIFQRISDDFMIQAGNTYPDGTTKESPYGNIAFEYSNFKHEDGAISMASTGAGVGGSAQFFICDGEKSFLDGSYAAFGKTIYGMSVVRDIADDPHDESLEPTAENPNLPGGGKPLTDIIINSINIENQ